MFRIVERVGDVVLGSFQHDAVSGRVYTMPISAAVPDSLAFSLSGLASSEDHDGFAGDADQATLLEVFQHPSCHLA